MGIQGLLPNLASITKQIHIRELANCRVGVDAYVWLHKGAYSCSMELCQNIPTDKYIRFCMKFVKLLLEHKVTPILVFDGASLPIKHNRDLERKKKRDEYKQKALEHLKNGARNAAIECFQRAVDITPRMAFNLIQVLQQEGIEYIVAPYEADAQLAYLSLNHYIDAVITEDSDLIPYGASRIIFKLDKHGNGKEIRLSDLGAAKELDFVNFTSQMLRHMCILSGCDYIDSIVGLGPKKAHAFIKKYRDINKVFRCLRLEKKFNIPIGYEEDFKKADITFLHQRVYDPVTKQLVPLTPFPDEILQNTKLTDLDFIGPEIDHDILMKIVSGEIDPHSKLPFESSDSYDVNVFQKRKLDPPPLSQPMSTLTTRSKKRDKISESLPIQMNKISHYFTPSSLATTKPFTTPRPLSSRSSLCSNVQTQETIETNVHHIEQHQITELEQSTKSQSQTKDEEYDSDDVDDIDNAVISSEEELSPKFQPSNDFDFESLEDFSQKLSPNCIKSTLESNNNNKNNTNLPQKESSEKTIQNSGNQLKQTSDQVDNDNSSEEPKILAPDTPSPKKRKRVRVIFKSKYFDTSSSSNGLSVSCSEKCTTLSQSTSCNFIRNLANDFERLERNENETKPVESQLLRSVKAMSFPSNFSSPLLGCRRLSLPPNNAILNSSLSTSSPTEKNSRIRSKSKNADHTQSASDLRTRFSERIAKFAFVKRKMASPDSCDTPPPDHSVTHPTKKRTLNNDNTSEPPKEFIEID